MVYEYDLIRKYIGEMNGLKAIGKEIHKDPRNFKHNIEKIGIKIPFPGSIWTKAKLHLDYRFFKPIDKDLEEIIIGSLLGDAQIRLQSKALCHENNPSLEEYENTIKLANFIRKKALNLEILDKLDISNWNNAIDMIRNTNTANFRIHKSILEIEWVKVLTKEFKRFCDTTTYIRPIKNSKNVAWSCGFDTQSSIQLYNFWKEWYIQQNRNSFSKITPIKELITPNSLLHWYIGDGHLSGYDFSITSIGFSYEENKRLLDQIKKLGIKCKLRKKQSRYYIGFSCTEINRMNFESYLKRSKYYKIARKLFPYKFDKYYPKKLWLEDVRREKPELFDNTIPLSNDFGFLS